VNREIQALQAVVGILQEMAPPPKEVERRQLLHRFRHLRGRQYVIALSRNHVPPPQAWIKRGCPPDYETAYRRDRYWRGLIYREVAQIRRTLDSSQ
jgi:hypothetical protein